MIFYLIPFGIIAISYQFYRFFLSDDGFAEFMVAPFLLGILPVFILGCFYVPVRNYLQSIKIIYQYEIDENKFSLETITVKIVESEMEKVIETDDTFKYFGQFYKAKKFIIGQKTYYYPMENMSD